MINLVILNAFTETPQSGTLKISACEAIGLAFESRVLPRLFFQPENILRSYLNFTTLYSRFMVLIRLITSEVYKIWRKKLKITSARETFDHSCLNGVHTTHVQTG